MRSYRINNINKAISEWFEKNKSVNKIAAKELMPLFIQKGIFVNNNKDGLLIRTVLRELDNAGELKLIPSVFADRKPKNTNWYFVRDNTIKPILEEKRQKIPVSSKKSNGTNDRKTSFLPISDKNSRILILGSLPGAMSLAKGQYYANSNNHFWKIINAVFGEMPESYQNRCKWLLQNGIALWDVIASAERKGSLDNAIYDERANDFISFFKKHPKITTICFNGTKAQSVYQNLVNLSEDKKFILLPSSSSARAMKTEEKVNEWKRLLESK